MAAANKLVTENVNRKHIHYTRVYANQWCALDFSTRMFLGFFVSEKKTFKKLIFVSIYFM